MTAEERRKKHQLELKEQLHEEAKVKGLLMILIDNYCYSKTKWTIITKVKGLLMILIDNYCYSKTKWTITTNVYIIISQWELKEKTSRLLEARENANDQITNALVLHVVGQEDIVGFLDQSQNKVKQTFPGYFFDTQLTLYTLKSVYIFSILLLINFLRCW